MSNEKEFNEMFIQDGKTLILRDDWFQKRLNKELWGAEDISVFLKDISPERLAIIDTHAKETFALMKQMLNDLESIGPNQFRCVGCRKVYDKGWSDEEAMAECVTNFGPGLAAVSDDLMCDDCYNEIHPHKHPDKVAAAVLEHMINTEKP